MNFPLPVPPETVSFLRQYGSLYVIGHKEPDGDCIGSQIALASVISRLGKTAYLLNPGPFERQEVMTWDAEFITSPDDAPPAEAAVVVDCSSEDRIGDFINRIRDLPTLVIDHHATGEDFGTARYIRPTVPATTILIASIIASLELEPTENEANLLFLGLATDTGFFRFIESHQAVAFDAAAYLTRFGASPRRIDTAMFHNRSFESRLLVARMIQRSERIADNSMILTYQTTQDDLELGIRRDSDALYRLLLSVEQVRAIVVVKEKPEGCAVSLRSNDDFDVGALAKEFGGGGHQKAAGAFVRRPLTDVLSAFRIRLRT